MSNDIYSYIANLEVSKYELKFDNNIHFLLNDNSLNLLKLFPDNSIDLIITDPPYNIGLNYGIHYKDKKKSKEYYDDSKKWLSECARILDKKGTFYLINYPEINARLLPFIEDELKLKFKRWITWHYPTNIGHSKKNFTRSQRSILFFTKSNEYTFNREFLAQHYKNPEVRKVKERIESGSKGRSAYDLVNFMDLIELINKNEELFRNGELIDVFYINLLKNVSKDRFNKKHPCQLPLYLLEILVKVSSNKNDCLLDPFAGTFTLSAIAKKLDRNSIGIEINPDYVNLGLERVNK